MFRFDFKEWFIFICHCQGDGNGFGGALDCLEQCKHHGLAFSEQQLGMQNFNFSYCFFKLNCIGDGLAALSKVDYISSGAGL